MTIPAGSSFDLNSVALDVVSGTLTISALDDSHVAGSIQGTFQDGTPLDVQFDVPYCTSECSAH